MLDLLSPLTRPLRLEPAAGIGSSDPPGRQPLNIRQVTQSQANGSSTTATFGWPVIPGNIIVACHGIASGSTGFSLNTLIVPSWTLIHATASTSPNIRVEMGRAARPLQQVTSSGLSGFRSLFLIEIGGAYGVLDKLSTSSAYAHLAVTPARTAFYCSYIYCSAGGTYAPVMVPTRDCRLERGDNWYAICIGIVPGGEVPGGTWVANGTGGPRQAAFTIL